MKNLPSIGIAAMVLLTAAPAGAADLGYPGAPVPAAFDWSGCFIGGHAGATTGHTSWQDSQPVGAIDATMTGQTAHTDMSGGLYGGQLGCDWQPGAGNNFVLGLQGAGAGATLAGTNMDQFNATWALRAQTDWIASVTGRLGWSVDRVMLYGRGGIAFAHNRFEIENNAILDGLPQATRTGWVLGAGVEWAFAPNWSLFGEADYYNFRGTAVDFNGDAINPTPPFTARTAQTVESVLFGVNYRFSRTPVSLAARY